MMLPGLLYFLVFRYLPMVGVLIAFQDFNPYVGGLTGFLTSEWVGIDHFAELFRGYYFPQVLWNTIVISFGKILVGLPVPILVALLLNDVKNAPFKRTVQTIIYLPHFLSWVVVGGFIYQLFSPATGLVPLLMQRIGMEPINLLTDSSNFRLLLIGSDVWRGFGWGTILYLAALSNIDPQLYDSADIDGASRLQRMLHISLPSILPVITVVLLLRLGRVLDAGFYQVLVLYSPQTYGVADVIDTYAYREGLVAARYSFGAAVGLFKGLIGLILVVSSNALVKRLGQRGIF
jgi:putative aldouronate transport system permease protein